MKQTVEWPNGKTYTIQPANKPLMLGAPNRQGYAFLHRGECHRGEKAPRTPVPEELLPSLIDGERLRAFNGQPRRVKFCHSVMK